MTPRIATAVFVLSVSACTPVPQPTAATSAPPPAGWVDPSPHQIRFVTVAPGIRLELLDWGGDGPPLIFLAGLTSSAHIFDDFAPAFRDRFHVYGVTRRGFGASSQPKTGYDIATLSADLVRVLDDIGAAKASFAGHSIAGEELTWLAVHEPERIDKLVYLDAAYDRVRAAPPEANGADEHAPPDPTDADEVLGPPDPTDADKASVAAFNAYLERNYGIRLLEAELRATSIFDAGGRYLRDRTPDDIVNAILQGVVHPDYAHIAAPALAIYAVPESAERAIPFWNTLDAARRAKLTAEFAESAEHAREQRDRFRREVPRGRVVEIRDANHHVFISHPALVLKEMKAFLTP
jgi:pimeloyl-ACP methyl ester carboxylesterase